MPKTLHYPVIPGFSELAREPVGDALIDCELLLPAREDLRALADAQAAAPSAERRYLSRAQVAQKFAADPAQVSAVEAYLTGQGFTVVAGAATRRTVRVRASAARLDALFGVDLRRYEDDYGAFISHTEAVELPDALAAVQWVFGLDQRAMVEPDLQWLARGADPSARAAWTAPQIAAMYDFPGLDGAGQCVGVIGFGGGYLDAELERYFEYVGLPGSPRVIASGVNRRSEFPLHNMETTMNTQIIASICPAATVVVYLGATERFALGEYYQLWRRAIFDAEHQPSVLSNSWSWPEGTVSEDLLAQFDELFACASLMGVSICSSSGNTGAISSHESALGLTMPAAPRVRFPSAHPDVLACGGTTITVEGGRLRDEVVMNRLRDQLSIRQVPESGEPYEQTQAGMASTGGVSQLWPRPDYQVDADVPALESYAWSNGALRAMDRVVGCGVPDVAANADIHSGYEFMFLAPVSSVEGGLDGAGEGVVIGGGTSASTPLWAALLTLLNQGLGRPLGRVHEALYRLALADAGAPFGRITRGNNGGYEATSDQRWNACSGLGSPRGAALLDALRERD